MIIHYLNSKGETWQLKPAHPMEKIYLGFSKETKSMAFFRPWGNHFRSFIQGVRPQIVTESDIQTWEAI